MTDRVEEIEALKRVEAFLHVSEMLRGHGGHILTRNDSALYDDDLHILLSTIRALQAEVGELREALKPCAHELFWCAKQAGVDWDDANWRAKSKLGKAYDAARTALKGPVS